jgi:DNA-binding CsgD family transcriptional regulator/tetratricopeptide (TPR) repeat protein
VVEDVAGAPDCLVGRELELAVLEEFLGSGGIAPILVVTGGPGIGKTALWEAGLRLARGQGIRVLAARPSEAEAQHSFAALFDLLEGISTGVMDELPVPQRRALEAALLRSEPMPLSPEPFAIAAGFLTALRCLAAASPLLLAVDDLQWLDAASADVLAFAARRFHGPRCRFLFARRSGRRAEAERVLGPAGVHRIELGPLDPAGTHRLLSQRLGLTLPRRILNQVFDATHGNPLLALEAGRTLRARETRAVGPDMPIAGLADNPFGARVAGLAQPARRALLATALGGHMPMHALEAVADPLAVEDLVADGLLIADGGRVRPTHPLLAMAARRLSSAAERRALHLDLAASAGDETLRARHLALAAAGRDAGLAGIIAKAAAAALRRGAVHDAVDLAEHALRLTPPAAGEYPDRLLAVAEYLVTAGEPPRARALLAPRTGDLPAGSARARAHLLLGEAGNIAEHEHHLDRALAEAGAEPALQATALATKSTLLSSVRVERIREAEAYALQACGLAPGGEGPEGRHALVALAWARILRGLPVAEQGGPVPRALEFAGLYEGSLDRPAGVRLAFRGEIGAARAVFHRLRALADERGEGRFLATVQIQICELELRAGEVTECVRLLDRWDECAAMEDTEAIRARCQALLAAVAGVPEEAERLAAALDRMAAALPDGDLRWDQLEASRARGVAALLADRPEDAAGALSAVWEHTRREGVDDPGAFPAAPDLIEALVRLGRTGEAAAVARRLRGLARRQRHPWGLATAERCAAAIALAARYDEDSAGRLAAAAATLGELGLGFDRARSLLWLGQMARRARKRAAARRYLEAAAAAFDGLGCAGWAGQARMDLARLGTGRPVRAGELTAAEKRVAGLAASGLSNKQIARRLFIAVHTVEVHLAHAYAKLGIRSRAQLAGRLAAPAAPHGTPVLPHGTPAAPHGTPAPPHAGAAPPRAAPAPPHVQD